MASLSDKAGFLIVANLIKYAVGFVMPMVLVRMLTKEDYGTYQQLNLLSLFGVAILVLGLPNSVYYFYDSKNPDRNKVLTLQTVAVLALSGALTAAAMVFGAPWIARFMNNPALGSLLAVYGISIGLLLASEHFVQFMIAQDRYRAAVIVETLETLVRVLILILPLLAGYGLTGLVFAAVGYTALRFVFRSLWVLAPLTPLRRPPGQSWFIGEQIAYSVPLSLMSLVGLLGSLLDKGIVASSFTPADYAIYSVGALEIPLDAIFQASVATVLRASLPALIREGKHEEVAKLMRESVRKLSLIVLPCFVFLLAYSYEFITVLFTSAYADSVSIFRIYLFLMPLNMFILSPIPPAYGRTRINLYVVAVAMAIHVVTSFALLHWIGFYGPAISAVVTAYLLSGFYFFFAMRLTGGTVHTLLPLLTFGKVFVAAAVAVLLTKWLIGSFAHNLFGLAVAGALFSTLLMVLAIAMRVFNESDKALARRWIGHMTARLRR